MEMIPNLRMHAWMKRVSAISATALFLLGDASAKASTIWDGPPIIFTKANGADWTQPSSQDRITANVWITRATTAGLFNARTENVYTHYSSPSDTEWAYGTLANYNTLTYTNWEGWNGHDPPSSIGQDAVVHLISEDVYISIKLLSWGGSLGGFSYERSTQNVPEPTAGGLGILALVVGLAYRRLRSAFRSAPVPG